MLRVFKKDKDLKNGYIIIDDKDFSHLKNSLRICEGEPCEIIIDDRIYFTELEIYDDHLKAIILREEVIVDLSPKIILYQCFLKGNSMDFIIEKATELGVDKIIPVISHHTIARPNQKRFQKRKKRFEKIAEEASKQSKRKSIPEIGELIKLKDINDPDLICAYEKSEKSLKEVIREKKNRVSFLIGPEGGFSKEEMRMLLEKGVKDVSLGSRILKAETAPLFFLSVVEYELNN